MTLTIAAVNINAQLVVDSLGRVGIGTDAPLSMLSVGNSGSADALVRYKATGKKYGLFCHSVISNTNDSGETLSGYFHMKNNFEKCCGVRGISTGGNGSNALQRAIGITGYASSAPTSIGLYGGKYMGSYVPDNFAGVYGSTGLFPNFGSYPGIYAGYFNGKVRVTNGIYATVLSPAANTSQSGQGGITILSDRGENVIDKLSQVQTIQFFRFDPTKGKNISEINFNNMDIDIDNMSPEELDSLAEIMGDVESECNLSPIQYGLDANQLKTVYPELVYEDENGNVSINYMEMVPLLVQSIKELKNELAELKGNSLKKAKAQPTAIDESAFDIDMVRMDQNRPNPFSESTAITLYIPEKTQSANIFIYDMSGKQVKNHPVSERGETNIIVYATDLSAGMYIYTFVVDGKMAVTRRMIVEK